MRRKRKKKGGKPMMTEEMGMSEWRREDYIEWSGGGGWGGGLPHLAPSVVAL